MEYDYNSQKRVGSYSKYKLQTNISKLANTVKIISKLPSSSNFSKHYIALISSDNDEYNDIQYKYVKQSFYINNEEFKYALDYYNDLLSYNNYKQTKVAVVRLLNVYYQEDYQQQNNEIVLVYEFGESDRIDVECIEQTHINQFIKLMCDVANDLKQISNLYHSNIEINNLVLVENQIKLSGFKPRYQKSNGKSWKIQFIQKYSYQRLDVFLIGLLWVKFLNINVDGILNEPLSLKELQERSQKLLENIKNKERFSLLQILIDVDKYPCITIDDVLLQIEEINVLEQCKYNMIGNRYESENQSEQRDYNSGVESWVNIIQDISEKNVDETIQQKQSNVFNNSFRDSKANINQSQESFENVMSPSAPFSMRNQETYLPVNNYVSFKQVPIVDSEEDVQQDNPLLNVNSNFNQYDSSNYRNEKVLKFPKSIKKVTFEEPEKIDVKEKRSESQQKAFEIFDELYNTDKNMEQLNIIDQKLKKNSLLLQKQEIEGEHKKRQSCEQQQQQQQIDIDDIMEGNVLQKQIQKLELSEIVNQNIDTVTSDQFQSSKSTKKYQNVKGEEEDIKKLQSEKEENDTQNSQGPKISINSVDMQNIHNALISPDFKKNYQSFQTELKLIYDAIEQKKYEKAIIFIDQALIRYQQKEQILLLKVKSYIYYLQKDYQQSKINIMFAINLVSKFKNQKQIYDKYLQELLQGMSIIEYQCQNYEQVIKILKHSIFNSLKQKPLEYDLLYCDALLQQKKYMEAFLQYDEILQNGIKKVMQGDSQNNIQEINNKIIYCLLSINEEKIIVKYFTGIVDICVNIGTILQNSDIQKEILKELVNNLFTPIIDFMASTCDHNIFIHFLTYFQQTDYTQFLYFIDFPSIQKFCHLIQQEVVQIMKNYEGESDTFNQIGKYADFFIQIINNIKSSNAILKMFIQMLQDVSVYFQKYAFYDKAQYYLDKCLTVYLTFFSSNQSDICTIFFNLSIILAQQKQYLEASFYLMKIFQINDIEQEIKQKALIFTTQIYQQEQLFRENYQVLKDNWKIIQSTERKNKIILIIIFLYSACQMGVFEQIFNEGLQYIFDQFDTNDEKLTIAIFVKLLQSNYDKKDNLIKMINEKIQLTRIIDLISNQHELNATLLYFYMLHKQLNDNEQYHDVINLSRQIINQLSLYNNFDQRIFENILVYLTNSLLLQICLLKHDQNNYDKEMIKLSPIMEKIIQCFEVCDSKLETKQLIVRVLEKMLNDDQKIEKQQISNEMREETNIFLDGNYTTPKHQNIKKDVQNDSKKKRLQYQLSIQNMVGNKSECIEKEMSQSTYLQLYSKRKISKSQSNNELHHQGKNVLNKNLTQQERYMKQMKKKLNDSIIQFNLKKKAKCSCFKFTQANKNLCNQMSIFINSLKLKNKLKFQQDLFKSNYQYLVNLLKKSKLKFSKFQYIQYISNLLEQIEQEKEQIDEKMIMSFFDKIILKHDFCIHDAKNVIIIMESLNEKGLYLLGNFFMYMKNNFKMFLKMILDEIIIDRFQNYVLKLMTYVYTHTRKRNYDVFVLLSKLKIDITLKKMIGNENIFINLKPRYQLLLEDKFNNFQYLLSEQQIFHFKLVMLLIKHINKSGMDEKNGQSRIKQFQLQFEEIVQKNAQLVIQDTFYIYYVYVLILRLGQEELKNDNKNIITLLEKMRGFVQSKQQFHLSVICSYIGNIFFSYGLYEQVMQLKLLAFDLLKSSQQVEQYFPPFMTEVNSIQAMFDILSTIIITQLELGRQQSSWTFMEKMMRFEFKSLKLRFERLLLRAFLLQQEQKAKQSGDIINEVLQQLPTSEIKQCDADVLTLLALKLKNMLLSMQNKQNESEMVKQQYETQLVKMMKK